MNVLCLWSEWESENEEAGAVGCVSYPAHLTTEHAASSYGLPVVVIDGQARGAAEMPPGELQVPPEYLAAARAAGYDCQPLDADEGEARWEDATPLTQHWHPEARLVRY